MANYLVLALSIIFLINPSSGERLSINVKKLGAKADGKTDVSKVLLRAWNSACASKKEVRIYVPRGRYLIRNPVVFNGRNCKRSMFIAPNDYNFIGNHGNWIKFERVNGLFISGGTLDAKGAGLWNCKKSGKECPTGATSIGLYGSANVVVSRLTSINSQLFHMTIYKSKHVILRGIKISALGNSPNTDGIHVQLSSDVSISSLELVQGMIAFQLDLAQITHGLKMFLAVLVMELGIIGRILYNNILEVAGFTEQNIDILLRTRRTRRKFVTVCGWSCLLIFSGKLFLKLYKMPTYPIYKDQAIRSSLGEEVT